MSLDDKRDDGGSFKNVQNYINETKLNGTVVTRFTTIVPYDTPDAVKGFNQNKAKESAGYEY